MNGRVLPRLADAGEGGLNQSCRLHTSCGVSDLPRDDVKANVHIEERFTGAFRRVVILPEDADPEKVSARYRDGVLHISIQRRETAQPRRISIQ